MSGKKDGAVVGAGVAACAVCCAGPIVGFVAFAALFTSFDLAELVHQIDVDRAGLALITAALAVIHAAATLVAGTRATTG